jgi:hypothetical protein
MNKRLFVFMLCAIVALAPAICTAQSMSDDSMQSSSEDSMQDSAGQSSEQSSQDSSDQSSEQSTQDSSQNSSQASSDDSFNQTSGASSQGTSDQSTNPFIMSTDMTIDSAEATAEGLGAASSVVLAVGGAVVAIGLTVLGVIWIVRVSSAKKEDAIALQDQIYAGRGPDYEILVSRLGVSDAELVRANDELVAEGWVIETDQDAADYLVALLLRLDVSVEIEADAG